MRRKIKANMKYLSPFRFVRRYFTLGLLICMLYFSVEYLYEGYNHIFKGREFAERFSYLDIPNVVVHFDLKGAPPNLRYLGSMLHNIKALGATAILVEYDHMFPFKDGIKKLSSPYHYRREQLIDFLKTANAVELEVIPLIQTFGHMEYALKLEEFQHLREDPLYPDSICLSKNESLELIKTTLTQVIFLHEAFAPLKHIHIGGGVMHRFNICPECTKNGFNDSVLFIQHLRTVAKMIRPLVQNKPNILLWDDMLRRINISSEFQKDLMQLGKEYQIQPVFCDFTANLSGMSYKHMNLYNRAFQSMWTASAFKGADGNEAFTPDLKERLLNNLNWLKFMMKYSGHYKFKGIIVTGRSRYAHLQPICELLPVSYRSLTTNLMLINEFRYGYRKDDYKEMYTLKDWQLAYTTFFENHFVNIQACAEDKNIQFRPECSLNKNNVIELYDRIIAFEDAIKIYREVYINDLESKIMFGYIDCEAVYVVIPAFFKSYTALKNTTIELKKTMRWFFDQNVYKEYIAYKSSFLLENEILELKPYMQTIIFQHERVTALVAKHVYPRGRNIPDNIEL